MSGSFDGRMNEVLSEWGTLRNTNEAMYVWRVHVWEGARLKRACRAMRWVRKWSFSWETTWKRSLQFLSEFWFPYDSNGGTYTVYLCSVYGISRTVENKGVAVLKVCQFRTFCLMSPHVSIYAFFQFKVSNYSRTSSILDSGFWILVYSEQYYNTVVLEHKRDLLDIQYRRM